MTWFMQHPKARWAVPVVAAGVMVGTPWAFETTAKAQSPLAPITAAQLLADVEQAKQVPLSGEVSQSVSLGLPSLPSSMTSSLGGAQQLVGLLSGTHTWRVWEKSDKTRLALVDGSQESDVIANGASVWIWSSSDKTATHLTGTATAKTTKPSVPASAMTPAQAAQQALKMLDPTTAVTVARSTVVAGRQAYELVLTPKTSATRVRQVRIAVDAATHLPLRVEVLSTQASGVALNVGFTSISYATPADSVFRFTPPAGTKVTTQTVSQPSKSNKSNKSNKKSASTHETAGTKTVGSGWSQVSVVTLPKGALTKASSSSSGQSIASLLALLPTVSGSWGSGHVLNGTLVSVLITNDGRVAAGAVAPSQLIAALSAK